LTEKLNYEITRRYLLSLPSWKINLTISKSSYNLAIGFPEFTNPLGSLILTKKIVETNPIAKEIV